MDATISYSLLVVSLSAYRDLLELNNASIRLLIFMWNIFNFICFIVYALSQYDEKQFNWRSPFLTYHAFRRLRIDGTSSTPYSSREILITTISIYVMLYDDWCHRNITTQNRSRFLSSSPPY